MKTWKYHVSIILLAAVICFVVCYFESVPVILLFAVYGILAALDDVGELVYLKFRLNKLDKEMQRLNQRIYDPDRQTN